jgi:hypothetical protein
MSYKAIYDSIQQRDLHIERNFIRDQVLATVCVDSVRIVASGLDTSIVRGLYLSAKNADHPLVRQMGGHVIVVARSLNRCWQRFVTVKELMHMLDEQHESTDNGDSFDKVLSELSAPSASYSPQTLSEINAFWKALGVLCPERQRLQFKADRQNNKIDDYSIALQLRIPEFYVQRLMDDRFEKKIAEFLK